ncbi:MAG: Flp pilus assembly complex ATPase component TadA, partial [Bdellovibrionales bacterium]|nr:Flp pilus assembly complex ATPase component TadA [Bdellovibrionales bacterium]
APEHGGEKFVFRFADASPEQRDADASCFLGLGLSDAQWDQIDGALGSERGTVLVAGPTGSGKTTLLYSLLRYLNKPWRSIVTLEDPIERPIDGLSQTAIAPERGQTYASLLKALLRHDPDVIMLGEIRDEEAAAAALTAGITGHIVLSTLHASNCFDVLLRLIQFGCRRELIQLSLSLIIAQRLVGRVCSSCVEWQTPNDALRALLNLTPARTLPVCSGCPSCDGRGIEGRIGVFELLNPEGLFRSSAHVTTSPIGKAHWPPDSNSVYREMQRSGYQPLAFRVRELLLSGVIPVSEALRALGCAPHRFGYCLPVAFDRAR